jgi:hypothetical protein
MVSTPPTLDGAWQYAMHSDVSGSDYTGRVQLQTNGRRVRGTMEIPDGTGGNLTGIVAVVPDSIDLARDTGLETIQHFRIGWNGTAFMGRYWNEGKYPDSGSAVFRQ